jgi:hypothetical protein
VGRRIAVTSTIRHVAWDEPSAVLRIADLDEGRTVLAAELPESPYRASDPNPRGGLRGARGLGFTSARFAVANADSVFVFDRSWRMRRELSHPWSGSIHGLLAEQDGVWLSCSASDLVLKLGWDGPVLDSWCWRADRHLTAELGFRSPLPFSERLDYRDPRKYGHGVHDLAHVNAIARDEDGLMVSLGRVLSPRTYRSRHWRRRLGRIGDAALIGRPALALLRRREVRRLRAQAEPSPSVTDGTWVVVRLDEAEGSVARGGPAEVIVRRDGQRVPNHDVLPWRDLIVYNDSNNGRLEAIDRRTGAIERSVAVPGKPPYARGLAALDASRFLVGSQRPVAVHTIDLDEGRVVSSIHLGDNPRESVFAVGLVPESFDELPERLEFPPAGDRASIGVAGAPAGDERS